VKTQGRILVVDDTPANVKLLVAILENQNYAVITADSGSKALALLTKENPDLVLLDVMMPELNGYQVCQRIRGNPQTTLLPVIMVTALDPAKERVNGIEAGADDFLTKPINPVELLARVRSLLRIRELHNAVQAQATQLAEWNKELQTKLEQETKLAEVARMLGGIGHEIKNMLMPILSGAWLLQDELSEHFTQLPELQAREAKSSQEMSNEIIDMVRNNAQRIQNEMRDIADCVKGLSSPPRFSLCQLAEVVSQVIKTLQFLAKEKGISLQTEGLDDLPPIQADEPRLFKLFYNLINNAIPEVPAGGSITIQGRTSLADNRVVLSVVDTGRGMPQEVRESLFTTGAISTKPGGTGLGTKIVKDIIDAHEGSITVESQEGVGTTFHLHLPFQPGLSI
jgi:signal transduction histidine kinase